MEFDEYYLGLVILSFILWKINFINLKHFKKTPEASLFSSEGLPSTSVTGNINSYSSFRDEFSHREILNNPFDFDASFEEEHEEEPKVIILNVSMN